jgi:diguanylate cyclase (GGDEF)-like protein/PAS domain S-box-containing protein
MQWRRRLERGAWLAFAVAGGALATVYFMVDAHTAKLILWPLIGWSTVVAILAGVRLHRPQAAGAWYLLAAGVVTFIVGDNLYSFRNLVQHATVLFPSYVDGVYLAMYPLLIAGLVLLVRRRAPGRDWASLIDATIITGGLGLLSWVLLIDPYVRSADLGIFERLVSIAYPVGDVALLAVAVRLAVGAGRRTGAFWLLAGSIVPLIVADALYGYTNLAGTWHEHSPIDLGWILFYVGWGAAALHPSMASLSQPANARPRTTRRRVVIVGLAALIPPALLFIEQLRGSVDDGLAIAVCAAALFALVLARMVSLTQDMAQHDSEERFQALVQNSQDAIVVVDNDGRVMYQTPSATNVLGYQRDELNGRNLAEVLHPNDAPQLPLMLAMSGVPTSTEWLVLDGHGRWLPVDVVIADLRGDHRVGGVVLTLRDCSARKSFEDELRRRALHDTLTGLANRALLIDRIDHALRRADRTLDPIAVLFIDIDDFKVINDSLGHGAGDQLLVTFAERLQTALRPGDTAARFGGDEFAVVLENGDAAESVACRVNELLRDPFAVGTRQVYVRASIGVALSSSADSSSGDLIRDADLAMYVAKRNGKGRYEVFTPDMHAAAVRHHELSAELHEALSERQVSVKYQPIVDVDNGRVVGVEALARWHHPERGPVAPSEFVAVAETSGLIVTLGRYVLRQACADLTAWRAAGEVDDDFYVAVNLSARQIHDPNVVEDVTIAIVDNALPPSCLVLEVTESTLMEDIDTARGRVASLRALGVRIAIDDFGTGYSSLGRLGQFAVDTVKIDKSFVDQLASDVQATVIIRSMIEMSHALRLTVVAEGIEQSPQLDALQRLGCDLGQGYFFSRPVAASELTTVLGRLITLAVS